MVIKMKHMTYVRARGLVRAYALRGPGEIICTLYLHVHMGLTQSMYYSGTGLESKVCVRATIGLFECISEPNFRSLFAYVCSKPGVSFNTSMWMDHTNKP